MGPQMNEYDKRLEERAAKIRAAFAAMPGFLEMIRQSQLSEKAGRLLTEEELTGQTDRE